VINKKSSESFTSDDLRLLSILASQSGQLIRNSELQEETIEKKKMDQELLVARKIQMDLLPQQRPEFKNLQIAAYLNPADQVGGDYYDYFPLDENRIGMVLADVSGHGPSAALVMTMVKGILHSITQKFESPASVLTEMNSILYRIAPKEIFVTMAILLFDREKMLLKYSNAGHNPILFYDEQTHTCQPVSLPGPALGISPRSNFNEKVIPLHTGDGFLIYTDGITESCNQQGEMFEEKRLIQIFEEVVTKPADIIIQHITGSLEEFTHQAHQADDVAMITTKVV
jgi:sigma-B regulation protein RsbU (phosphoserine phosphatase)